MHLPQVYTSPLPPPSPYHPSGSSQCTSPKFLYPELNMDWRFVSYMIFSQFSSVLQSCPTLCDPVDCSTPGFPVHHQLPELAQTHVHHYLPAFAQLMVMPCNHLILCCPLLLLPSIFPSIRVFSYEVAKVLELELELQHWSFQ